VDVADLARAAATALLLPLLAGLLALALFGRAALALGERLAAALGARGPGSSLQRVAHAVLRFGRAFDEGLAVLRSPGSLALVAGQTALLFASAGWMMWILARSFDLERWIGYWQGLAVLAITMLGIALPAPPGFAGVVEASVRGALALFGVRGEALAGRALAYALVCHWWPFLLLVALAGWFLWRDRIGLGRLFRFARRG
jgi:uncharacterized membrane protein YbhN (UPF0104 family)